MATKKKTAREPERKPRADAERNRELLLETAKAVFAAKGAGASLEEIARQAGLGIGTLYRHFPTRDALIEAVFRADVEQLVAAAERLILEQSPVEALRSWLLLMIEHLAAKRGGMGTALQSLTGGTTQLYAASTSSMEKTVTRLIDRAVAHGELRCEMPPLDLLRAIAGVAHIGNGPGWRKSATQLVDVLIAGMRRVS
jgi:AcrR family transcriptional regulator